MPQAVMSKNPSVLLKHAMSLLTGLDEKQSSKLVAYDFWGCVLSL